MATHHSKPFRGLNLFTRVRFPLCVLSSTSATSPASPASLAFLDDILPNAQGVRVPFHVEMFSHYDLKKLEGCFMR